MRYRAVKEALRSLVGPTRKESGCLCYNLHQSKTDPTQFMFYEQWANKDTFDAHGKTPHMKALGGKLKDKTAKGGGLVFYEYPVFPWENCDCSFPLGVLG